MLLHFVETEKVPTHSLKVPDRPGANRDPSVHIDYL
jgi:hypothetical protein